jgi:hypothetical protein
MPDNPPANDLKGGNAMLIIYLNAQAHAKSIKSAICNSKPRRYQPRQAILIMQRMDRIIHWTDYRMDKMLKTDMPGRCDGGDPV